MNGMGNSGARRLATTAAFRALTTLGAGLLLGVVGGPSVAHADPIFALPYHAYETGFDPYNVAIADVNGDGRLDMISANRGDASVSVLLGIAPGEFGPATRFAVGDSPIGVATGDVNGDGKLDLAVVHGSAVAVMLGAGDGTFAAPMDYPAGNSPMSAAIGDLDGDGRPDLLVTNMLTNTVSVLRGTGNGAFAPKVDYAAQQYPQQVVLADLDGDGRLDVITANLANENLSAFHGNGDGTLGFRRDMAFSAHASGSGVAVGDLNHDAHPDLAVVNSGGNYVTVVLGVGDGTFGSAVHYATAAGPLGVVIGDIDGDGNPDVATVNHSGIVSVLTGIGNGTLAAKSDFVAGNSGWSIAMADLNGDGRSDVVVSNSSGLTSQAVVVLANPGTTAVAPARRQAFSLASPRPNPTRGPMLVSLSLPNQAPARLELVDVSGRRVLEQDVLGAGARELEVKLEPHSTLAAGLYFVRLTQSGRSLVTRACVVK